MVASSDADAPLAVVIGITGQQGGSVANALIQSDKPYRIVGLTRDTSKPSAQAWAQRGVQLREVDITPGKDADVIKAFDGANIVFVSRSDDNVSLCFRADVSSYQSGCDQRR